MLTTFYQYIWGILFAGLLGGVLSCSQISQSKKPQRPNILLINADDLGWRDLGFMGSSWYETPHLDSLAVEGMVFTRAYSAAANCAPSRACLLSGLNTPRHDVYTVGSSERGDPRTRRLIPVANTRYLADNLYTLPEMLRSAGYVTASFGKWHIGETPSTQGIDHNVGGSSRGSPGRDGYFSPYRVDHLEDGPPGEYLTDRLTNEAIAWLKEVQDTSFFLYVPYYSVHTPLMGKPGLVKYFQQKPGVAGQSNAVYAAMIASLDENVGKLLRALRKLDLDGNTLVIFTSDNGGIRAISDQSPLRAGKGSYYEGGIRVPLLMRWPGKIAAGVRNDQPVSHLDLFPTLQALIRPPIPAEALDGRSLIDQFGGEKSFERDLFFHFPVYLEAYSRELDDGRDPLFRTRPGSVVISGHWKLHEYFEDGGLELYSLDTDPGERHNLAKDYPARLEALHSKLRRWREKTGASVPRKENPLYDPAWKH